MLRHTRVWLCAAGMLLPLVTGCTANHNVVRGQNPEMPNAERGIVPSDYHFTGDGGDVVQDGTAGPVYADGGYGPCDACNSGFCVKHECYRYKYRQPRGLV